ncbi:putative P-loop containing nucleoside triphosphate hydrolase, leucine-rich repeat domain superfamily [Helianthus debilis subsp. tardiflorus]
MLEGKNKMISCVAEGTAKINEVLQMKKVLIVLDDIDEHDELGTLLGTKAVHTQSRIIVTTRLLDMHSWFDSISWRCHVHELTLLNDHESLEVLSCHAFGSKHPLKDFSDLAIELAGYCGGNPLALKVLGSSLFVCAHDPRERNSIIEIWRSRLNLLSSLKGDLDYKIRCVLQKSFDSLPLACYKELFLHIAVFFVGEDEDYVVKILEHDLYAKVGIMTLINRCLLTVSSNNKLMMHQLLQDMGRTIIHEESKDPARHARVWCSDEAYRMLTKGDVSGTIEGLTLDTRKLRKGTKILGIKTCLLAKMNKLKFLQINYVKLNGCYKNFPELRWLCWHGCHLKRIPSCLLMSRFLVAIDMTNGNLKKFEPPMVLNSLKILNLKDCYKLDSIHKLYWLPNLETLILEDCINLTHVCITIEDLENLALLNLKWCRKLWKASWNKKMLSLPQSLKYLFLDYCNCEHQNALRVVFNGPLFGMSLRGCLKLSEVQGLFKLVSVKELDEAHLGPMKWIKAYDDHKVDLVGAEITKGKIWDIQMLQEFGIRSTYLQGIKDQSMMALEYTSAYNYISLHVSSNPKKHRIQGLNVSCLYKSSAPKVKDNWLFFTKISNITKGVTWIYNPLVYCKPKVDEDTMWLSYWPIGNILDAGDEVNVSIVVEEGMIVSGCGASLVYVDDGEVVQEEKLGHKTMIMEEVIGGDLSEFEVTPGVYYLCRHDFFKSSTRDLIKRWPGDIIHYTKLQGWNKSYETQLEPIQELNRDTLYRDTLYKRIFLGYFNSESNICKIRKAVSKLMGVDCVLYVTDEKMMYVLGSVDSLSVETCVKEFEKTVRVIYVDYNAKRKFEHNFYIFVIRAIYFRIHGSK